jgi:hypothetical protein
VNGKLIASIADSSDGTSIGQTNLCTSLDYTTATPSISDVDTLDTWIDGAGHIPQPYLPRSWNVNTTTDAPMIISLYMTDEEIAALQGATLNHGNYYYFDSTPELLIAAYPNNADTLVPAGSPNGLVIQPTFTRVDGVWEVTFRIPQSATFYLYPTFWKGSPLPVEMVYFKASASDKDILLTWSTASELNNLRFDIERSTDAQNFMKIGEVPGLGNSHGIQSYDYTDEDVVPGVIYYYRLKQVDIDGKSLRSKIERAQLKAYGKEKMVTISQFIPNPARQLTRLRLNSTYDGIVPVKIFSINGNLVTAKNYTVAQGDNEITLNVLAWPAGIYMVVLNGDNTIEIRKLTKIE